MPKAILYVESSPASPEREDEYNHWYSNTHVPEILALPGFTGAVRYKAAEPVADGTPAYIAVYDIDADDPQAVLSGMFAAMKAGKLTMSDCISPGAMRVYDALG
jgi:hypothetical protein